MIAIEVPLDTVRLHEDVHNFLHLFDLHEWTVGCFGAPLIRFTPIGCCEMGQPGCPFKQGMLVNGRTTAGTQFEPVPDPANPVLPKTDQPKSAKLIELSQAVKANSVCTVDGSFAIPIETCFKGPACVTPRPPTVPVNLDALEPTKLATLLDDIFDHPTKYIEHHFHYAYTKKLSDADYTPTPALPRFTARVEPDKFNDVRRTTQPFLCIAPDSGRSAFDAQIPDMTLPIVDTLFWGEPTVWLVIAPSDESRVTAKLMGE